jgi:hypothetical protein
MRLWFFKLDFKRDELRPGSVKINICLKDSGHPITPSIAGLTEFDTHIEQLRSELNEIQKQGHRKFAEYKAAWKKPSSAN